MRLYWVLLLRCFCLGVFCVPGHLLLAKSTWGIIDVDGVAYTYVNRFNPGAAFSCSMFRHNQHVTIDFADEFHGTRDISIRGGLSSGVGECDYAASTPRQGKYEFTCEGFRDFAFVVQFRAGWPTERRLLKSRKRIGFYFKGAMLTADRNIPMTCVQTSTYQELYPGL